MTIKPINYENGLTAPDQLSGHGTHVLGLTLGGPGFDRSLLQNWLTIAVVAVSPGQDKLDGLSVSDIISAVGKVNPRIVNMSIEYSREQLPDLNLLTSNNRDRILFVVAAGNGYKSVEEQNSYPAMLAGGSKTQNILVVGATKGPAEPLVAFSNTSEEKVGTAAPGCRIRSWIGETDELVRMSGTSQSTPIVTFTSALVNSMMAEDAPPEAIRYRIQVSGDPSSGDAQTQAHTVTNVERALFVNYDYISYQPSASAADLAAPPIELIGELRLVPSWKPCMGIGGDQTWSFAGKPSETGLGGISILTGYQDGLIMPPVPCKKVSPAAGKGRVQFRAAWKLNGTDKPERVTDLDFKDIDIPLVNRFIRKGPGARIN
nr:S8 family serine peptidase [Sphingomonas kyeonggiensis]